MNEIPVKIKKSEVAAPDMICGGTPCQAFSLAGWRNGLVDDRGQLTLKFIDVLNECDAIRKKESKPQTIFFWENVEGVLSDKTNAFGCFIAGLVGLDEPISVKKWTNGGVCYGKDRNIAWRVLDSKYFGVPQQRKRIYVVGGGRDFHPERVLFEVGAPFPDPYRKSEPSLFNEGAKELPLTKTLDGHHFEVFRSYSDCVYTAYGTKWNGNAAAFNGSLFVAQDGRVRRLTPIECERLMGFPDNYTKIYDCTITQRYQAIGNSWAVPVVSWVFSRILKYHNLESITPTSRPDYEHNGVSLFLYSDFTPYSRGLYINASTRVNDYRLTSMIDVVENNTNEKLFLSPAACKGILRRKESMKARINDRLEVLLHNCSR